MNIDIFTFVAQIINLIVLLFLLRKFLYLPVLRAVDKRQKEIASELHQAEEAKKNALAKEKIWQQKLNDLEANQKIAEAQYEHWQQNFKAEQQNFEVVLQQLVIEHFRSFSQKVIKQMAGASLSETVIERFKEKFSKISATEKAEFVQAAQKTGKTVVQTAHKLSKKQKESLEMFLQQQLNLPKNVRFSFEEKKELICGVSLQIGEQAVAWNFESYLQDFRRHLSDEIMHLLSRG